MSEIPREQKEPQSELEQQPVAEGSELRIGTELSPEVIEKIINRVQDINTNKSNIKINDGYIRKR